MPTFTELSKAARADVFIETACSKYSTTLEELASTHKPDETQLLAAALLEFELMEYADAAILLGRDVDEIMSMVAQHVSEASRSRLYHKEYVAFIRACGQMEGMKMAQSWTNQSNTNPKPNGR